MTQKKYKISPEDIDLKQVAQKLKEKYSSSFLKKTKQYLKRGSYLCGKCIGACTICAIIFPKAFRSPRCPCSVYLQKDVAHVVKYLLLNLKI